MPPWAPEPVKPHADGTPRSTYRRNDLTLNLALSGGGASDPMGVDAMGGGGGGGAAGLGGGGGEGPRRWHFGAVTNSSRIGAAA